MSDWNAFEKGKPEDVIKQESLGEPTHEKIPSELDLSTRRLKSCIEKWPDAEIGQYNPACCRFPKNCNPFGRIEAVEAGNLREEHLEIL